MNSITSSLVSVFSNAGATTIYYDIYYRSGFPSPASTLGLDPDNPGNTAQLRTLAEEVGHVVQFAQGMSLTSYVTDWWHTGSYANSTYEHIAKEFAGHVVDNFNSGTCTGGHSNEGAASG